MTKWTKGRGPVHFQGAADPVGEQQVPEEADQAVGHQQQRAGGLYLQSTWQRRTGEIFII